MFKESKIACISEKSNRLKISSRICYTFSFVNSYWTKCLSIVLNVENSSRDTHNFYFRFESYFLSLKRTSKKKEDSNHLVILIYYNYKLLHWMLCISLFFLVKSIDFRPQLVQENFLCLSGILVRMPQRAASDESQNFRISTTSRCAIRGTKIIRRWNENRQEFGNFIIHRGRFAISRIHKGFALPSWKYSLGIFIDTFLR